MPGKTPTSRDINKEEMFRKIMPSAAQAPAHGGAAIGAPDELPLPNATQATQPEALPEPPPTPAGSAEAPAAATAAPPSTVQAAQLSQHPAAPQETRPEPEAVPALPEDAPEVQAAPAQSAGTPAPAIPQPTAAGKVINTQTPAGPAPAAEPVAAPESAGMPDSNPVPESPSPSAYPAALSLEDADDIHPVNLVEILMDRYYPRYCQRLAGCDCQRCKDDVYGMALNKVTPRYVRSDQVREEDLANRELVSETVTALMQALFAVKNNPHHDEHRPARQ